MIYIILILLLVIIILFFLIRERRLKKAFDSHVSYLVHELRTPISTLSLGLEMMGGEHAAMLRSELERMERITSRLLSNRLVVKEEDFDIYSLIEGLISSRSSTDISLDLVAKDYIIKGDRFHFENILNTIVDNSIKFGGSKINISSKDLPSKGLEISISDNGIGINKAEAKKVFKQGYRSRSSTSKRGYGIGLSYVYKAVRAHGGRVWFDINYKQGACIIILIPNNRLVRV